MVGDLRMWLGRDQTRQPTQMRRPPAILTEHPDQPGRSILSSTEALIITDRSARHEGESLEHDRQPFRSAQRRTLSHDHGPTC
jgi:hypothetical protein